MTREEARAKLGEAQRGSVRDFIEAAVDVANAGLAYAVMTAYDAAWAEALASARRERDELQHEVDLLPKGPAEL